MKKNVFFSLLIFSLVLILQTFSVSYTQDHPVISDSIYSSLLKEERSIKVLLSDTYKPGLGEKYEVIYLTDREWAMDLFSFVYKFAKSEYFVPPAIIVAIPNRYINKANQRDRDFLPVHVPEIKYIGERVIRVAADGNSATVVIQYIMPVFSPKIPLRDVHKVVKTDDKWMIDFFSTTFIPKNEDVPAINKAVE
jgi:enterochelin esterase-like enzyme